MRILVGIVGIGLAITLACVMLVKEPKKVNTGTTTPVTNIYLISYQKTIGTNPVAVIGNRVATGTKVTAIDINALVASIVGKDTNSQVVILNVIKLDQ